MVAGGSLHRSHSEGLSEESTRNVVSFQDMLSLLADEYKRVSVDNAHLAAECSHLRACLSTAAEEVHRERRETDYCTFYKDEQRAVARKVRNTAPEMLPASRLPVSLPRLDQERPSITSGFNPDQHGATVCSDAMELDEWRKRSSGKSFDGGMPDSLRGGDISPDGQDKDFSQDSCNGPAFSKTASKASMLNAFALSTKGYQFSDVVRFGKRNTRSRLTLDGALRGANMRMSRTSRLVVNPERSKFLLHWDQITIAALAFVAVMTPVQVSMMDTKVDALFFVNCVVDLVFFLDMVLQFFMMYPIKTNYGIVYEHRHSMIIRNYLKGWFIIDLASILPFDVVSVMSTDDGGRFQKAKAVKVIRLLRLLKLARMCKVSRLFRRLEMRMAIAYQRLALAKFLTMLVLVTHWMANLWALTLVLVDEDEDIPRWVDVFAELEKNVDPMTKDSNWKLYLTCLYFTSYTITSVGYGDIGPRNIIERIVCTSMIFISGITWALLIAQVCSIVSSMDAEEQNFRKIMDELNYMMAERELPGSMRRRLRSFFLSNKSSARHIRHQRIMETMSPALRGEVSLEMNRMWITKVSFLKAFLVQAETNRVYDDDSSMQNFMVDVSASLIAQVYAQGEAFGAPQVLYILNRGLASHTGRVRRSGAVWGTDFVLSDTRFLEPYGSFSLTYVEVTFLRRDIFMQLVDQHNRACPQILKIVRRYAGWLALQRWILAEAKRRQRKGSAGTASLRCV